MTGDSEKDTDKKIGNSGIQKIIMEILINLVNLRDPQFQELFQVSKNSLLLTILNLKNHLIIKNQMTKTPEKPKNSHKRKSSKIQIKRKLLMNMEKEKIIHSIFLRCRNMISSIHLKPKG